MQTPLVHDSNEVIEITDNKLRLHLSLVQNHIVHGRYALNLPLTHSCCSGL